MNKSVLGNCLILSIYFLCKTKNSKIKMYYTKKYGVISFYVIVNNSHRITFSRDRTKPVIIKNILFYIQHKISKI